MNQNPYEPVPTGKRDSTSISTWRLVLSILLLVLTISVAFTGIVTYSMVAPNYSGTRRYATYDSETYLYGISVDPSWMKSMSLVLVPLGLLGSFLLLRPALDRKPSSKEKRS